MEFSLSSSHGFSLRIMILAHFQVMRKCLIACRNKLPCFLLSLSLCNFLCFYYLLQVSTISPVHSPGCVFIFINSRDLFGTHEVEEGPNQLMDLDINALDMFPIVQLDQFHFGFDLKNWLLQSLFMLDLQMKFLLYHGLNHQNWS